GSRARGRAALPRAGPVAGGVVGTPSPGLASAAQLADVYKDAAARAGRAADVIQMRDAWVARTRAEADLVYGPHVMAAYRYYWEARLAALQKMTATTKFRLESLALDRLMLRDPEPCLR